MPRGVKKQINYDEEISKIETRITHHKNSIAELEEQKNSFIAKKEEAELKQLRDIIKESGQTPAEFLASIQQD